jgi:hypothetical protein
VRSHYDEYVPGEVWAIERWECDRNRRRGSHKASGHSSLGYENTRKIQEADLSTTLDFATVTHSIASLSISGVTVKDIHEIPDMVGLGAGVLSPRPDNFVTGFSVTPAEVSSQNLDVRYTLNYVYFHCKIQGGLGGLFSVYSGLITAIAAIVKAFANDAKLSGSIDGGLPVINRIGPIMDASGNSYHGCEVSISILQFLEV